MISPHHKLTVTECKKRFDCRGGVEGSGIVDEEVMFKELNDIKIKNARLKLFTGFQFVENPEYITKYSEMSVMMPEKLWLSTKQS